MRPTEVPPQFLRCAAWFARLSHVVLSILLKAASSKIESAVPFGSVGHCIDKRVTLFQLRAMHYDGLHLRWANRRVHTRNVVFGEVLYQPGGFCGPRVQRDFELVILHSGQCRVTVDNVSTELQVGTVYLFLPNHREHFRFSLRSETHHSYCSIRPGFISKELGQRLRRSPKSISGSEVFRLLWTAAFKLRTPQEAASTSLVEQLGICLFTEYLGSCHHTDADTDHDPILSAFLHHIEDNFGKEDCLLSAHRAAGISRNSMIEKFRAKMNTTPARYLWRFRTERGAAMLAETGLNVAEIGDRCGFKSQFHFSRLIKQRFDQSPRALRQQAWAPSAIPAASLDNQSGMTSYLRQYRSISSSDRPLVSGTSRQTKITRAKQSAAYK